MEEEITKEIIPEKFPKLKDIKFQIEKTHQKSMQWIDSHQAHHSATEEWW